MVRMAEALEVDNTTTDHRPKDKILNYLYLDFTDTVAFSVLEEFKELSKEILKKAALTPATSAALKTFIR